MPHLVLQSPSGPVRLELNRLSPTTVGRGATNDVFVNDLHVSPLHFRIRPAGAYYFLEECGSENGTAVNGDPVEKRVLLGDGDEIRAGRCAFRFEAPESEAAERVGDEAAEEGEGREPVRTLEYDLSALRAGYRAGTTGDVAKARERALASLGSGGSGVPDEIPLRGEAVLGRGPEAGIRLDHPAVSRRHALLRPEGKGWTLRDLNSANGTFVDHGEIQGKVALRPGSEIRVGPFRFEFRGDRLSRVAEEERVLLECRELSRTVRDRRTGKELRLLDRVSLGVRQDEFVAILGPTGSGKSTMMDALSGRRRLDQGTVRFRGGDLYAHYDEVKHAIAYVPQRDIVHGALTVERALRYAARLRLPPDTGADEIESLIARRLEEVGLSERRGVRIDALSGGQIRRVSLAAELLSDPALLFLDEVTSGLDPRMEREMMELFRKLADNGGRGVVCVTHSLQSIHACHLVAVMARGRLAYYGPPDRMAGFFGVDGRDLSRIYDRLEGEGDAEQSARKWAERYAAGEEHRRWVASRVSAAKNEKPAAPAAAASRSGPGFGPQFRALFQRALDVLWSEGRSTAILFAQAPLLALVIVVAGKVMPEALVPGYSVFFLVLVAFWLGCNNGAGEIAKEVAIVRRERAINVSRGAYLASKLAGLGALGAAQCAILYGMTVALLGDALKIEGHAGVLGSVACAYGASLCLGLAISALSESPERAARTTPLAIIPQVVFAGALFSLGSWKVLGWPMVGYWAFTAARRFLEPAYRGGDDSAPGAFVCWAVLIALGAACAGAAWKFLGRPEPER